MLHQFSKVHLLDWQTYPVVPELPAVAQSSNSGSNLGPVSAGDEFGICLYLAEGQ